MPRLLYATGRSWPNAMARVKWRADGGRHWRLHSVKSSMATSVCPPLSAANPPSSRWQPKQWLAAGQTRMTWNQSVMIHIHIYASKSACPVVRNEHVTFFPCLAQPHGFHTLAFEDIFVKLLKKNLSNLGKKRVHHHWLPPAALESLEMEFPWLRLPTAFWVFKRCWNNPLPGIYETLQIMGYLPYQLVIAGFLNHQPFISSWWDPWHMG